MTKVSIFWYKFNILRFLNRNQNILDFSSEKPRCFVFLAADYGNLGDVAITFAQEKYLKEHFPEYEIIDVPISKTLKVISQIKKGVKENDIITITGGGNMGDMYFDIELLRLMVVKSFPKNRVIVFPQTLDYSGSKDAKALKKLAKKIYTRHLYLTICVREKYSFENMRKYFPNVDVRLTPDIVMTLDLTEPLTERKGVLFCLRDDKEKADNDEIVNQLIKICEKKGLGISHCDTHIGRNRLSLDERENELNMIWQAFRKSEIIVTDRLHGMIFAYITGTPALVLPNNNFKIEGCYEWLENTHNITIIRNNDYNLQNIFDGLHNSVIDEKVPVYMPIFL